MAKPTNEPEPLVLGAPRPLKLYQEDLNELDDMAALTGLSQRELLRRAVHVGVPVLKQQLQPTKHDAIKKPR